MIIDAKDLILGKLGTFAAKKALEGETVDIINAEQAVITGRKELILEKQKTRMARGTPVKGPFFDRNPDRFVKRSIRGMLPHRTARGTAALDRIKCHVGVPSKFKDQKAESPKYAQLAQSNALEYVTVGRICKLLGAKK